MSNTVSRLTIAEDAWERREKSRLEDEQEELNKRKVEEFRRIKTATPMPEGLPDTLPGGSRLDTTPAVTVLDMLAPHLGQQEGYDYETDEEEFGGREDDQDDQEDAMDQYETDEEEFDPGPTSNGLTSMQQVNLGQSNRSPGDTLEYKSECPQVQDEHPCMKAASEEDDEHGDGVRGTEVHYETDEDEFEREEEPVILPGGSRLDTTPAVPVQNLRAGKSRNTAKRNVLAVPRRTSGTVPAQEYHLGFFNLWWSRMLREGMKEEKERVRKEMEFMNKKRFKLLLKVKTNMNSPALESRVDRMMITNTENMCYNVDERISEGHPTNQGPPYCRDEYPTFGGENGRYDGGTECGTVVGGVVSANNDTTIHERTQALQHIKVMTQHMNDTTGYFGNNVRQVPGFDAVGVKDCTGIRESESDHNQ